VSAVRGAGVGPSCRWNCRPKLFRWSWREWSWLGIMASMAGLPGRSVAEQALLVSSTVHQAMTVTRIHQPRRGACWCPNLPSGPPLVVRPQPTGKSQRSCRPNNHRFGPHRGQVTGLHPGGAPVSRTRSADREQEALLSCPTTPGPQKKRHALHRPPCSPGPAPAAHHQIGHRESRAQHRDGIDLLASPFMVRAGAQAVATLPGEQGGGEARGAISCQTERRGFPPTAIPAPCFVSFSCHLDG